MFRDRHGAMVRAWRLVQDFQRNVMFLPFQSWDIVSMLCPPPSNASLDSGENVYLVEQRWQCVR